MTARGIAKAMGPPQDVATYLAAPYVHMIIPNAEEGGYLAEVLELPGCISQGDSPEEAYANVRDAMAGWIAASLDAGKSIPAPVGEREYSGHFPLRISSELHRATALRAMQEGVSLNQWFTKAITAQVTQQNLLEDLAAQIAAKVAERLGQFSITLSAGLGFEFAATGDSTREVEGMHFDRDAVENLVKSQFLLRGRAEPGIAQGLIDAAGRPKEVNQDA